MNNVVDQRLQEITERITERSRDSRKEYMSKVERARLGGVSRKQLSCGNLAHGFAACSSDSKKRLIGEDAPNFAIVSAYNEMLSAHQPYHTYPEIIRDAAHALGAEVQFAGGVPAMCDGVTQGQDGMELSLLSRDVIAMSTAIALSHNMFDGILCLGVCDKIVPGLLMGALSFGHLPTIFVPAGPMETGLSNSDKAKTRQLYSEGKIGRDELLESESKSYHSAGTCTFYGTANSNQMLMEIMGLHLPGSSFVNPGLPLRDALTRAAVEKLNDGTRPDQLAPLANVISVKTVVNGMVGLLATGGSTNHSIHMIAMAKAAGIQINWQDLADVSSIVPLLCRIYPNGNADINHFHAAGGVPFLVQELLKAGLLHEDVRTVFGEGLRAYTQEPFLVDGVVQWRPCPAESLDHDVLRPSSDPFSPEGGMALLKGGMGRAVIKVSAVKEAHRRVTAPAIVFNDQDELGRKFERGELERDFIAVIRYQGPKANGMPELHKLTPVLGVLQDRGFKVALVTDGRMSGASGKVPAAIHLSPEALDGGIISVVRDDDVIALDADAGTLELLVSEKELSQRIRAVPDLTENNEGMGRELFSKLRSVIGAAEDGASVF